MDFEGIRMKRDSHAEMVAHALSGFPHEACGLLVGPPGGLEVVRFAPCTNVAASAKLYTIADEELDRVATEAIAEGLDIVGTMHSHTHTEPYPSPTDQMMALPWWVYVIVSLRRDLPSTRAFRMDGGDEVVELPVTLV